jgi:DNA repair protein SbcD/Mre11
MKLLHTTDWHLGRALYNRKRYDEYEAFLNWLAALIESEEIDALLVAGDVFDNSTPSNRAQELYYRFLCRVAASPRRHVVVTAGPGHPHRRGRGKRRGQGAKDRRRDQGPLPDGV